MVKQCGLDLACADVRGVSRNAMVAGVVSGRGTGRRRIRGAAHVQCKGREEFAWCDSVVQCRALRPAAMAVDCYRISRDCGLFAKRWPASERSLCNKSRTGIRDGTARLFAACTTRSNGRGISSGIHVDGGNAIELGMFVPGQRSL